MTAFNFAFVPPRFTFSVDLHQHALLLATMLSVSWIVALLMARQRRLAEADLPVFSLAQSRPSLDDVYLQATGRTLMDAELAVAGQRDTKAERRQSMR